MTARNTASESEELLPVYEITRTGIDDVQATKLAEALRIPREKIVVQNGAVSFVDSANHLSVPHVPVKDPIAASIREATRNYYPDIPVEAKSIDYSALNNLSALDADRALRLTSDALEFAGLTPEDAKPVVGHTVFKTVSTNARGALESTSTNLDTHVRYRFTLSGHPLVGPGAQVQVHYDTKGNVTQLLHAMRTLKKGPMVKIIPVKELRDRFLKSLPDSAEIKIRLVYWAPPLTPEVKSLKGWSPRAIIPWYAITVTRRLSDSGTQSRTSRVRLIPATDDRRFVPSATLNVNARQRSVVDAHVSVSGGTPPYTYLWAGSNTETSASNEDSIRYIPTVRDFRPILRSQLLERIENVVVTVIDANGVLVQTGQTVPVVAQPVLGFRDGDGSVTYGCESPNDPGPSPIDGSYAPERIAWQQAMGAPNAGGGSQQFCWLADASWPGDYIEPVPPGTLVSDAWINGDADYSNWGINTTNIMLYNGDGCPSCFTEMYPGATPDEYNASGGAVLFTPGSSSTVQIGSQYYFVNYNGSWGTPNPGDNLQWLAMYACNILENDSNAPSPWLRWGPAFNGLHSMVGFASEASDAGVGFMGDFPNNILGVGKPPETIVQGWLDAAMADDMGTPAAMGPIWNLELGIITVGISDYSDYYWGKGSVGITIPQCMINGWWYIQGTDAVQDFP
ncbi:MAG: DUF6345 domain-containing protein [Nitrososphaeria archaeon]|jgi:hypothetical protein